MLMMTTMMILYSNENQNRKKEKRKATETQRRILKYNDATLLTLIRFTFPENINMKMEGTIKTQNQPLPNYKPSSILSDFSTSGFPSSGFTIPLLSSAISQSRLDRD